MVSLPRHFVPNPVLLHSTRRGVKRPESLFLHTRYNSSGDMLTSRQVAAWPDMTGNDVLTQYTYTTRASAY